MDRRTDHGRYECLRQLLPLERLSESHPRGQIHHEGTRREGAPRAATLLPHYDEQAAPLRLPLQRRTLCDGPPGGQRRHRAPAERQKRAAHPAAGQEDTRRGRECHQDDDRRRRLELAEGTARNQSPARSAGTSESLSPALSRGRGCTPPKGGWGDSRLRPWLRGRRQRQLQRCDDRSEPQGRPLARGAYQRGCGEGQDC